MAYRCVLILPCTRQVAALSRGRLMLHYTGNLKSGEGNQVARGATRRMQEARFVRIVPKPEAFGVLGFK